MIAKKNPKADLEKKRFAFFQIGLIVSGSLCLAAFEYSTGSVEMAQEYKIDPVVDMIPVDIIEDPFVEPPKKAVQAAVIDLRNDIIVTLEPIVNEPIIVTDPVDPITFPDPGIGDPIGEPVFGEVIEEPLVLFPDKEAEFPGGLREMGLFINDNIDLPNFIPDYDQGTVYVEFVVNKDGSIEQVGILRGLSDELNKAAKDVVKQMPKWTPGEQAGKPVKVKFTLPIQIKLN